MYKSKKIIFILYTSILVVVLLVVHPVNAQLGSNFPKSLIPPDDLYEFDGKKYIIMSGG